MYIVHALHRSPALAPVHRDLAQLYTAGTAYRVAGWQPFLLQHTDSSDERCAFGSTSLDPIPTASQVFSNLPNELAYGNHSTYEWVNRVVSTDLVEGLSQADELFVSWTISR